MQQLRKTSPIKTVLKPTPAPVLELEPATASSLARRASEKISLELSGMEDFTGFILRSTNI